MISKIIQLYTENVLATRIALVFNELHRFTKFKVT